MNSRTRERSKRSTLDQGAEPTWERARLTITSAVSLVAADVRRLNSFSGVGCRMSGLELRASLRRLLRFEGMRPCSRGFTPIELLVVTTIRVGEG
jgi:hypothetical protein